MRIYKDENERAGLIQKALAVAEKYTWQATAEAVWQGLLQAVNKSAVVHAGEMRHQKS